jgi:tetratricopeptide (TPR) repeat protein
MLLALLLAAAPAAEIPITSTSPQAVLAFRTGRDKVINFQIPEAAALFTKALALDPGFVQAQAWMGKVTPGVAGQTQLEKAVQAAALLSPAERKSVEVLLAERRGEEEKARTLRREIAELAPGDWLAQFNLGVQSYLEHKSQLTIVYMSKAVELNPSASMAYVYRGEIYVGQGQFEQGLADLKKCVELTPEEANSWDSYAEVQMLAGHYAEAETNFAKAAQMAPDSWMSWLGLGYSRFLRGDYDGGRAAALGAKKYIARAIDELAVDVTVAWSWLGQGNSKEALAIIDDIEKRGRKESNEHTMAWVAFERAEMLTELGRYNEAAEQLEISRTRTAASKLSGGDQNRLRRAWLILDARLAVALNQAEAADHALAQLQSELATSPSNAELRATVHYAEGLVQVARGEPGRAAQIFALCSASNYICRRYQLEAQLQAGSKAAADETRARILAANYRDMVHRGDDPEYLYVVSRLRGGAQ